jgi:DNA-binding response OmpR family regulator
MLFLIANPVVREAFFPAGSHPVVVEPAKPGDEGAIRSIADRHEPPLAAALVQRWWRSAPDSFFAVRDVEGATVGFSCVLEQRMVTQRMADEDPVMHRWREHLRSDPMPKGNTALFHRWWLGRDRGEAPSLVQAATWLDLKRLYMQMRPALRRVYGVVRALDTYFPTFHQLGFQPLPGDPVEIQGVANYCAVLDFGSASVDGWLTWLAASELGIEQEGILDVEQRQLVLDGRRVPLRKLEFEVIQYLLERDGRPVSRTDLLRDVWGYDFAGSSNVVDVVVRSLRRKLGDRASMIETVRNVGYRLREDR